MATKPNYGSVTVSKVLRVNDGDTFYCNIDSWPKVVGENIGIRIGRIDTPEKHSLDSGVRLLAQRACDLTTKELGNAKVITLRCMKRGKYFRIIADVYVDGKSLAVILLRAGLAKSYDGGVRPNWEDLKK